MSERDRITLSLTKESESMPLSMLTGGWLDGVFFLIRRKFLKWKNREIFTFSMPFVSVFSFYNKVSLINEPFMYNSR